MIPVSSTRVVLYYEGNLEANVERAHVEVTHGNQQLGKAVTYKVSAIKLLSSYTSIISFSDQKCSRKLCCVICTILIIIFLIIVLGVVIVAIVLSNN